MPQVAVAIPPAGVADVPAELQRKFRLMRELDERTHQLETQVDADCLQQLKELAEKQPGGPRRGALVVAHHVQQGAWDYGCAIAVSYTCQGIFWQRHSSVRAGDGLASPAKRQRTSSGGAAAASPGAASGQLQERIENSTSELLKLSEEKVS